MNRLCVIVRITLLSVIVAGPLVNQVVIRNAGFWPISNGEDLKIGFRPAEGQPEADFETFPIRNRPKSGPKLSPYKNMFSQESGHHNRQQ